MSALRFKCEKSTYCLRCDNSLEELEERGLTSSDGSCKHDPDACQIIKDQIVKEREATKEKEDELKRLANRRPPCCHSFAQCENADDPSECWECTRNWDNEEYYDNFSPIEVKA